MHYDLRERDLHALLVEEYLQISGEHALTAEDVLLGDVSGELEIYTAVAELLHTQIAGRCEIQLGMLIFQSGQGFIQHGLELFEIGAVSDAYHDERYGIIAGAILEIADIGVVDDL